jgi:selenocysteine lyase/cysteine desulfurase
MATYHLDHVRSQLPVLHDWTYLNTGTVGIMPDPVLECLMGHIRDYEQGGHTSQHAAVEGALRSKAALARLLAVDPQDIAFNRNATDGINTVAAAFPLAAGDEVITSTEEHPDMVIPWLAACDRAGAQLRFIPVSPDADEMRASIEAALTPCTRMIAMSHVSCETGSRIPVQVIRDASGPDVALLIDASQSVGQFPFALSDLRADFVIGNGHKWLAGPKGTGFIWIAPGSIDLAPPVYFASDTVDPHWSREHYQRSPNPGIKLASSADRFEFGTRFWHLHAGLADAIEYQASLGWDNIEAHMSDTSTRLKERLSSIPDVTLHSPLDWSRSSGLVTFSVAGHTGEALSRSLWDDYRIAQRRVEQPSSVRVSCAYFTNDNDLERLVQAVAEIAAA